MTHKKVAISITSYKKPNVLVWLLDTFSCGLMVHAEVENFARVNLNFIEFLITVANTVNHKTIHNAFEIMYIIYRQKRCAST